MCYLSRRTGKIQNTGIYKWSINIKRKKYIYSTSQKTFDWYCILFVYCLSMSVLASCVWLRCFLVEGFRYRSLVKYSIWLQIKRFKFPACHFGSKHLLTKQFYYYYKPPTTAQTSFPIRYNLAIPKTLGPAGLVGSENLQSFSSAKLMTQDENAAASVFFSRLWQHRDDQCQYSRSMSVRRNVTFYPAWPHERNSGDVCGACDSVVSWSLTFFHHDLLG